MMIQLITRLKSYYFQLPILLKIFAIGLTIFSIFGWLIHLLEPTVFPTVFDGIWWALVTGATVGYGDFVPHTLLGRLLAFGLILTGGGAITFYMAMVSASTIKYEKRRIAGKTDFNGSQHLVVIGWNERSRQLITRIHQAEPDLAIVLIDQTFSKLPAKYSYLHFIKGDPTIEPTISAANGQVATAAIITADPGKDERLADQASILTTIALRGCNPTLTITTEILTADQVINAKHAGATKIIETNKVLAELFQQEL